MLKAQIILQDNNNRVEPLSDALLTEVMKRAPDQRVKTCR